MATKRLELHHSTMTIIKYDHSICEGVHHKSAIDAFTSRKVYFSVRFWQCCAEKQCKTKMKTVFNTEATIDIKDK